MKVWMDGRVMDGADAKVSVLDHGLLYGDGVFEGIRAWNGHVFRLGDHLSRLQYGAKALHLPLPVGTAELHDIVQQTVDAHDNPETYVRLVVTRGVGPLGIDTAHCGQAQVFCIADTLKIFSRDKQVAGITLSTASRRRPDPDAVDPRVKSLNYLNNVLARVEARRAGADAALMLNRAGHIAEVDVANLFVWHDGVLVTPPTTDGSLDGMTRKTVLELAQGLGIRTSIASLSRIDVLMADDAFLTGTGAGIVRVAGLDGETVGKGEPSGTTLQLMQAYRDRVQRTD